jgi:hypothetical protein
MPAYYLLDYGVSELFPLFIILKKHNISETGLVPVLSEREEMNLLSSVC